MGTGSLRRLGSPGPLTVRTNADGVPQEVTIDGNRRRVVAVREDWLVQDLWWTDEPIDRRYFELVLDPGRHLVVFLDRIAHRWQHHS